MTDIHALGDKNLPPHTHTIEDVNDLSIWRDDVNVQLEAQARHIDQLTCAVVVLVLALAAVALIILFGTT